MRVKQTMFKKTTPAKWRRVLCIDPGIRHLGYAFWKEIRRGPKLRAKVPTDTGLIVTPKGIEWDDAVYEHLCNWLREYILVHQVGLVVLEYAEFWGDSARSRQAAKSGDLLRLTFLVGALGLVVYELCDRKAIIIEPNVWKGDMPKPVMEARVRRALHRKYRKHEYDGVGIGLRIMGKL